VEAEEAAAGFAELGFWGEAAFVWGLLELPERAALACSAEMLTRKLAERRAHAVNAPARITVRPKFFSWRLIELFLADMSAYWNAALLECGHDGEESR